MAICDAGLSNRQIGGRNICCGRLLVHPDYINFDYRYPDAMLSDFLLCLDDGWLPTAKQLARIEFFRTRARYTQAYFNTPCPSGQTAYFYQTNPTQVGIPSSGVCIPDNQNIFETDIGAYPFRWYNYINGEIVWIPGQEIYPRKSLGESSDLDCGNCPTGYRCNVELQRCVSSTSTDIDVLSTSTDTDTQQKAPISIILLSIIVLVVLVLMAVLLLI